MNSKRLWAVLFMGLSLMGCEQIAKQRHEYVRNRGKDYLTSVVIAPLEVPAELSHPMPMEYFPVPEHLPPLGKLAHISLVPPGFGIVAEEVKS